MKRPASAVSSELCELDWSVVDVVANWLAMNLPCSRTSDHW